MNEAQFLLSGESASWEGRETVKKRETIVVGEPRPQQEESASKKTE